MFRRHQPAKPVVQSIAEDVTLANEVRPAAYAIVAGTNGSTRLEITKEQRVAVNADDQTWTCTASVGPGKPFTMQPNARFFIYDAAGELIATSQLRTTLPVYVGSSDSLSLTYRLRVLRTNDGLAVW